VAQLTTKPSAELPLKYQWLVQGELSYTLECTAATTNSNNNNDSAVGEDTVTALRLGRYMITEYSQNHVYDCSLHVSSVMCLHNCVN
jgi:hypothetical protein